MPRAVWVLAAGSLINRFGSFVMPFLVLYLRHRGYLVAQAGIALAAYGIGKIVAAPSGGYLADRLGARDATAFSMFLSAATMLGLWQSVRFGPVVVCSLALVGGWASELYRPSISTLIADTVPPGRHRVTAFAVYQLGANVGLALGPAVGGLMAAHSFAPLFLGDAATSVAWGVLALVALPRTEHDRNDERVSAAGVIVRDRAFVRFWLAALLVNVVLFQSQSTFPLWVTAHGHSSAAYGGLLALSAGMTAVFQLPLTGLTGSLRPWRLLAVASAFAGVGFGVLSLGGGLALLIVAVIMWSGCELLAWPVAAAWVTVHAPTQMVGRYAGARSLTFGLGVTIGSLFGTTLYGFNPRVLWLACLLLAGVSASLLREPVGRRRFGDPSSTASLGEARQRAAPRIAMGPGRASRS